MTENIARRWPAAVVETRYSLVQGPAAVEQLIDAIRSLDAHPEVDVIIVARGGGSLEDLLPFSDEALARAVFACRTPVVSAIGHETDTPILDLVADVRASTPTDAAKRVVPDAAAEAQLVANALGRVRTAIVARLDAETRRLTELRSRPVLRDPSAVLVGHTERLQQARERLFRAIDTRLREEQVGLRHAIERVRALSPQATLQRGYAILTAGDDRTVDRVAATATGAELTARLADGRLGLTVYRIRRTHEQATGTRLRGGRDQLVEVIRTLEAGRRAVGVDGARNGARSSPRSASSGWTGRGAKIDAARAAEETGEVTIDSVANFRGVAGLPCTGGGVTTDGVLYRSGALAGLSGTPGALRRRHARPRRAHGDRPAHTLPSGPRRRTSSPVTAPRRLEPLLEGR